jgi:hypothetical protein
MRLAIIEHRLEMRVVGRALAALTDSVRRPSDAAAPDPTPASTAPPRVARAQARGPQTSIDMPAASPEMTLARAPRSPAVSNAARAPDGAVAASTARPPAATGSVQVPPIAIDRITTEVVRALDARVIAWRERMGRS